MADVTVRDPKTGQIIFEGFLHHYSLNMSNNGYTFEVTGAIAPPAKATSSVGHIDLEEPLDIVKDAYPVAASNESCNHCWDTYQGLVESYEYCQNCGVKK